TLVADMLDLRPLQPADEDGKAAAESKQPERLFSKDEFDLTALRQIDADISLNAARLQTRQAEFMPFELKLKLVAGRLQITPRGHLASGQLAADVHLDAAAATPALKLELMIDDILPEQLPALAEEPFMRNGRTDIRFNGSSRGTSAAAIAGHFNGHLLVEVGSGELMNKMTNLAGADLIFSAFQMLNPMAENDSNSTLVCGVLNFAIEDGLATASEGVALQTNKVNVLGSAIVNLKTEEIDFRAKPQARSGMGVNISQLSDAVYIGGTIMNPRPATDVRGALKTAGRVGAAFATGGLSILAEGMFERKFSSDDPCGVALGKIAADGAPPEPVDEKGTLEKAGDGVRGMFRGIFGGDK
ncbi:MAG: AsmA family protein, partial [Gammaproteobacteria bacterium]